MNYPSKEDLLDMSIWSLQEHMAELQAKLPDMTSEQRAAFIRICQNIASMEQQEAA